MQRKFTWRGLRSEAELHYRFDRLGKDLRVVKLDDLIPILEAHRARELSKLRLHFTVLALAAVTPPGSIYR